ncbi:glycosyltransferase [Streptacidiphilus cavernicola]|uniref:4,4'-diaponeurosporenoate glycosyltransferase n=1 Tax=Streptacidiphilus cavernicola TaxID=3342716 RepID=A0ABV6W140_9ACTN
MTSIVIPAHNEGQVIGRLLDALLTGSDPGEVDIVVVCNGCTDDTAQVAALRGPAVRVLESPVPSKHAALRLGDEHARGFPRLYVDADVVLAGPDVRKLTAPLASAPDGGPADGPAVLATAPERELPMDGCAWRVRAYYRVWQQLPSVREGLFGRGVIAVSAAGYARLAALPPLMADDLAASLAFAPHERLVVRTALVRVLPPRTWADLIRRRIRAATSTTQLEQHQREAAGPDGAEQPAPSARTGKADLVALLRARPGLLPAMAVFLAAAVVARRKSRKAVSSQDFGTWLRDESSRQA